MSHRTTITAGILGLALLAGAAAQQPAPDRGYEERVTLRARTTIRTGRGPKTLEVTTAKLAVPGGTAATLALPERGFVVLQHRAGDVTLTTGDTRRRLQEGEWITIALPARVVLATDDDTALLDAIVTAE